MKLTIFLLSALASYALCFPAEGDQRQQELTDDELAEAAAAKYHFASDVQDGISDLTQQREEVRDGLKVNGFYSYSDGHHKRKITYEADENGYRVVKVEAEPLEGPQVNPEGVANIHTIAHGNEVIYAVEGDDKTRHAKNNKQYENKSE